MRGKEMAQTKGVSHRKKRVDINDLEAKEEAYGHKLTNGTIIKIVLSNAFFWLILGIVLYANIWLALLTFLIGCLWVYYNVVSREISTRYYRRGLVERNHFLNSVVQLMSSPNATVTSAMREAAERANGEFQQDLKKLLSVMLTAESQNKIHEAFNTIIDKYSDDILFCQFMVQLETADQENVINDQMFQLIKDNHNDLFNKQKEYTNLKNNQKKEMLILILMTIVVCCLLAVCFGLNNYIKTYAHSIIGLSCSTVYMIIYAFVTAKFFKYYYDESITTI